VEGIGGRVTIRLAPSSPRRVAASRFGAELRVAMLKRQVGQHRLAEAVGCGSSAIAVWKAGDNLPRTDTAQRLADALDWPKLIVIAREGRTGSCVRCGGPFINEGGSPKRFCSAECRDVDEQLRQPPAGRALAEAIKAELDRVKGSTDSIRRKPLAAALTRYVRSDSKRVVRVERSERRLRVVQESVAAFCGACEPSGVCRTPECELRPVSPLPLALDPDKVGQGVRERLDPHTPDWLAAVQAANAERWARPGERELQSARTTAMQAARTPEEREAIVAKSKAAYPPDRRAATSRAMHARRRAEATA
jgi:transcriptional regulator with XRE-family HTH domain